MLMKCSPLFCLGLMTNSVTIMVMYLINPMTSVTPCFPSLYSFRMSTISSKTINTITIAIMMVPIVLDPSDSVGTSRFESQSVSVGFLWKGVGDGSGREGYIYMAYQLKLSFTDLSCPSISTWWDVGLVAGGRIVVHHVSSKIFISSTHPLELGKPTISEVTFIQSVCEIVVVMPGSSVRLVPQH